MSRGPRTRKAHPTILRRPLLRSLYNTLSAGAMSLLPAASPPAAIEERHARGAGSQGRGGIGVGNACPAIPNLLFNNLTLLCVAQNIPKLFDRRHGLTRQSTLRPMRPCDAAYPHLSKTRDGSSDARFRLQFLRGSPGRGSSAASGRRDSYLIPLGAATRRSRLAVAIPSTGSAGSKPTIRIGTESSSCSKLGCAPWRAGHQGG
jgi:hypothetical protein